MIKFVILTIVCRSKSASELMLNWYVHVFSTLNKSSMSMSLVFNAMILIIFYCFKANYSDTEAPFLIHIYPFL